MKTLALVLLVFAITSCEVIVVEPPYDYRNDIIGYYDVEEYSETHNSYLNYSIRIFKQGNSEGIYIDNFYNINSAVVAEYSNGKIFIPLQRENGYEIDGVGTVIGNKIKFSFRVIDLYYDYPVDYCEAEAWKD